MQVFIISAVLWAVSLLALVRLWQPDRVRGRMVTMLMLILAGLLMMRPHEDIFGGEDPGSYINSGITYANQGAFFHTDPLLAQVQPQLRPLFYYGHSGFGATKDACLWVCNEQHARLGPRFQPAYPLLMSGLVGVTRSPWAALYVAPLFAIFAALALRALFTLFYPGRCAGWAVFWLFLLNPLTAWHGRCPRPEIVAAFLLFAGITMLLRAARGAPGRHRFDVWLGGLCCLLAPFMHVTAWFVVLPVVAVLLLAGGVGRRDLAAACLWVPVALWLLNYQARHITDYYGLGRMLRQGLANPLWWAAALFGIPVLWWGGRRLVQWRWPLWLFRGFAWAVGLLGAAAFVWCFFCRDAAGSLPFLGRPVEHLFYLTDFRAVVNMLSQPLALLGLLGWLAWCVAPGRGRVMRPLLAAMLTPAICLAGRINDFMMTRYLLVALVPMLSLGLAALANFIADRVERCWRDRGAKIPVAARRSVVLAVTALLLSGVGLCGRTHLVRLTEYRGLARFLSQFARPVAGCEGALLAEYSRLAAPFDHFFNLPVLAVDNERRDDYTEIEREWECLMRRFDDVPVFFITPFRSAVSDRFVFTPLRADVFDYRSLRQAGRNLPIEVRRNELQLTLYRLRLAEAADPEPLDWQQPYVTTFDAGNMGFRRFSRMRTGNWPISGWDWLSDVVAPLASIQPVLSAQEAALAAGSALPWGWRLLRREDGLTPELLDAWLPGGGFLADVMVFDQDFIPERTGLPARPAPDERTMPPMRARWSRADSAILLPRPPTAAGRILLLVRAPVVPDHAVIRLELSLSGADPFLTAQLPPNRWQWLSLPFPATKTEAAWVWLELRTIPAWNSGVRGFPDDLGVLVGQAVVLP